MWLMNKLNRDQRGFSMVELIIVIAIMSIMAGVVGYGFSLTNGKPAEECAKKTDRGDCPWTHDNNGEVSQCYYGTQGD